MLYFTECNSFLFDVMLCAGECKMQATWSRLKWRQVALLFVMGI